jgi:hypothetical protein
MADDKNLMLICVTETKTDDELEYFAKMLDEAIDNIKEESK